MKTLSFTLPILHYFNADQEYTLNIVPFISVLYFVNDRVAGPWSAEPVVEKFAP